MALDLLALPEELLCHIANCLEKDDLCSLRLTCKQLQSAATQALFSFVRLYPSEESITRYNKILELPEFNKHVRHVELNTLDKDEEDEECSGEAELEEECLDAFGDLKNFTGLTGATLRFSENSTSGNSWSGTDNFMGWSEWPQTYYFRQPVFQKFIKTLAHPSASKIKDICIDNIQNMNDTKFMRSQKARTVLSNLNALQLYIATEDHSAAPECNLEMEELHRFMAELRPLWLEPASNNLTKLVLYQSFYFGLSPKLDLRGLHLPHLQTLALGNYVFTHEWQLDWLSSHSATLQNLYLDDCVVVFYAKLYDCAIDADSYPIIKPRTGGTQRVHEKAFAFYDMDWARILTHIRTHLDSLAHFRIGHSTRWERDNNPFRHAEYTDLAIGLFQDRYMMFHMGIGPCQYTDSLVSDVRSGNLPEDVLDEDEGGLTPEGERARAFLKRLKEAQDAEDAEALRALLEGIGQGVPKDTKGVVGLLAKR